MVESCMFNFLSTEREKKMCICLYQILKIPFESNINALKGTLPSCWRQVFHTQRQTYPSKQLLLLFVYLCHSSLITLQESG